MSKIFENLIIEIATWEHSQQRMFFHHINRWLKHTSESKLNVIEIKREENNILCPSCKSDSIIKYGFDKKKTIQV